MSTRQERDGYAKLLDTGRHSDFEIECKGHIFKVHKGLICANSDFFDKLCDSNFVEGGSHKAKLNDEDPAILARMLLFIYTKKYPVSNVSVPGPGQGQFRTIIDHTSADSPIRHKNGVVEW